MNKCRFHCCGYKIRSRFIIFILLIIIGVNFCIASCNRTIEGLTNNEIITNNVLLGVGANYKLASYTGITWNQLSNPQELIDKTILAIALGPDGKLYAVGTDFRLYVAASGAWEKPKQPTSLQFLSITNENNQLIGIGTDYKLYVYTPSSGTVNPFPGETASVISALSKYRFWSEKRS